MHMRVHVAGDSFIYSRKRQKKTPEKTVTDYDFFESLPDDLVISIFCKLSSTATKPSDFLNVLITCVVFQPLFSLFFLHFFSGRCLILVFVEQV